jgi:hypothetical protein
VAITRAETTCTSGQWPAPMFSVLADYIRRHPRFLTQEEAAEAQRSAPRATQPAARAAQASPASTASPFAPEVDVTAVVFAYEQRYPLLRWDFLAERWQGGAVDVEALLRGHPFQSARTLVAAFVEHLPPPQRTARSKARKKTKLCPPFPR